MTVALLDLRPNDCRFPVGDLFCADARREGSSYCDHHHGLAYVTAGRRAFSSGGFMAEYTETVAPPRPARAHETVKPDRHPPATAMLNQFIRAAAARRHDAPQYPKPKPVEPPKPKVDLAEIERQNAVRLAQIKRLFVSVPTPQAVINQLPRIMQKVATKYGVSVADIKSARRDATVVRARQEFFYSARHETLKSYPEIAQFCGKRHHTTAMWGARQHEAGLRGDRLTRICPAEKVAAE